MSKKTSIKTKEFELPVYGSTIIFVYSTSYEAIEKFGRLQKFHEKSMEYLRTRDYYGYSMMLEDTDKKSYHYVIVKKSGNKYEEIDTITHEMSHTVISILNHKGIKFSSNNDEPHAYLTGYLNKEFFKFKDGK